METKKPRRIGASYMTATQDRNVEPLTRIELVTSSLPWMRSTY